MSAMRLASILCLVCVWACETPRPCKELPDELSLPLGFASYEAAGRSPEEWRSDLTEALLDAISFPPDARKDADPDEPRLVGDSLIDGTRVLDYELESVIDGELIPFGVFIPESAMGAGPHQLVILLHGHGETAEAPFDEESRMRNIGGRLLEEGYITVATELRSFGDFKVDGKGHDAYIDTLDDGEFVGQVATETVQVGRAVRRLFPPEEGSSMSIFGHSFGGYIALHAGALVEGIDVTMSSGHFTPYACVNTKFHHHGQDIVAMEGVAEIYDVVGMIAPEREVRLFFGGKDDLFTPASVQSFERLEAIFEKLGAPGKAQMYVSPANGHEVDPEAVIASFRKRP